jgi:hypothetical protein
MAAKSWKHRFDDPIPLRSGVQHFAQELLGQAEAEKRAMKQADWLAERGRKATLKSRIHPVGTLSRAPRLRYSARQRGKL